MTLELRFSTIIEMSLTLSSDESELEELEDDESESALRGIDILLL